MTFYLLARDARRPAAAAPKPRLTPLLREDKTWVLSLFYFLTFGGLVAMAVYLPSLLTDTELFGLQPLDAGFRTAGFVALATVMRPVGGSLGDRVGGQKILMFVFPAVIALALCMALAVSVSNMFLFTVGALGMAAAIGLGNGAVFKLVPQYFPHCVGSMTGLVGAAGGLGGFFPPLVLGAIRQATGSYTWGFVLLALFGGVCLAVCLWTAERSPKVAAQAA